MSLGGLGIEAEGWIGCMYREGTKRVWNFFCVYLQRKELWATPWDWLGKRFFRLNFLSIPIREKALRGK